LKYSYLVKQEDEDDDTHFNIRLSLWTYLRQIDLTTKKKEQPAAVVKKKSPSKKKKKK